MALTAKQLAEQKKQAEELLFSGPQMLGFAKALYFGHFNAGLLFPYPTLPAAEQVKVDELLGKLRRFADDHIDADKIDRTADIPESVVRGLGDLGVLGATAPPEIGGLGLSQQQYCKLMELIGAHCASTAVFVNAHHSIGIRSLILFGTKEQQDRWLPDLVKGTKLAAFALTEPEAGSDAGNVQTTADPTPDGTGYVLNGTKHYITNGGIADVLTVMARTPAKGGETKVTAFLVTPDMPGFNVLEARAEKCGIRGTATGKMRFENMFVPKENVLGQVGKGLRLALTVLDFGRTTFGATCTGAAKYLVKAAVKHVKQRVQFKQPLAEFELVQKKIAFAAAHAFAMEAMTQQCAAFIDRGFEDYMLETAMLKVFATDHLWTIVNDTIQLHGGKAYFCDQPFERMMRDARINTIGEGANDVLRSFIAAVGVRGPGMELLGVLNAAKGVLRSPLKSTTTLLRFTTGQASARLTTPTVPVKSEALKADARTLGGLVAAFGRALPWVLKEAGTDDVFLRSQLQHERIAEAATDLYAASCAISRLDHLTAAANGSATPAAKAEIAAGRHFLTIAFGRVKKNIQALADHPTDRETVAAAEAVLAAE